MCHIYVHKKGLKCATNNLAKYDVRQRFLLLVILVLLVCIIENKKIIVIK